MTSKYTKAAKGEQCTVRIPGVCSHDPAKTVAAHLNGGGMARKHHDIHIAFACAECHHWLDLGYVHQGTPRRMRDEVHMRAMVETQIRLIEMGILIL